MAKITEQDIINHLKEKVNFHLAEAKRLENILSAFNSEPSIPGIKKSKLDSVEETISQAPAKQAIAKVKTAKIRKIKHVKALAIPASYNDSLTVNGKIAFALGQIGSGFNEDIAEEIAKYQPQSDARKISKQISGILSTLKSRGQLKAEKSGRKDKFSLV